MYKPSIDIAMSPCVFEGTYQPILLMVKLRMWIHARTTQSVPPVHTKGSWPTIPTALVSFSKNGEFLGHRWTCIHLASVPYHFTGFPLPRERGTSWQFVSCILHRISMDSQGFHSAPSITKGRTHFHRFPFCCKGKRVCLLWMHLHRTICNSQKIKTSALLQA